ncbi:elongation factor EF1b gamma [Fadolivirus algeromassiliense]|jgi:hypothetical protein|uniref:Elongation factor EF1b gamma n=1 Tax=Fadolivirus FV1/VV64 TaxID=3070911 RepID=A0A7D3QUW5_9VIRU|nr:elongation factor EF1b gamma [Fadolivirus algeromassiliense]QKF94483.1 elongation factor EF1b gamma [Fadolivirus FV1/VV64]
MSDDECEVQEKKVAHKTLGNLEPVKRAFSNKEYAEFENLLKSQNPPYKYFSADYVDAGDFDGTPSFLSFKLSNRLSGFVKSLEDCRKYLFCAFSCALVDGKAVFKSFWIVNTDVPLDQVLGSEYDSFKFTPVSDLTAFVEDFKSGGVPNPIGCEYLH